MIVLVVEIVTYEERTHTGAGGNAVGRTVAGAVVLHVTPLIPECYKALLNHTVVQQYAGLFG